ncbi:MAG: chemotaxis protein CheR, partial [Clostridiaceae bacterium]|nr:chemotaxis protein CheR [Clostridiaceae bacterium]
SSKALNEAKKGVYSKEQIDTLPSLWRLNYFMNLCNNSYEIIDKIKAEVIFRKFNLMEDVFPFRKKFHTIFCRNVMIYFRHETKIDLVNKFYDILEYGGYLFIGHTESIPRGETRFKYVMPAVYRKI